MKKKYVLPILGFFIVLAISCKSKHEKFADENVTILVQLHDAESIADLESDFSEYALKMEKVVSRPTQIYLFTFNSKKIKDTELISLLKTSDLVKEAQQNRNVQLRN